MKKYLLLVQQLGSNQIRTYICVCVCVCLYIYIYVNVFITQILVQGEIKDLLLGIMDQNRSILQKWEGGHYPYEAVGVAEKATKGIISNSSSLNNGSLASTPSSYSSTSPPLLSE